MPPLRIFRGGSGTIDMHATGMPAWFVQRFVSRVVRSGSELLLLCRNTMRSVPDQKFIQITSVFLRLGFEEL